MILCVSLRRSSDTRTSHSQDVTSQERADWAQNLDQISDLVLVVD